MRENNKTDIFENKPVPSALATMAIPAVVSQLITLVYNIADTWFIGQTNNPYMVAAASLVATIFLMTAAVSNLFGAGGGNLVVRLLGGRQEEEASKAASWSVVMAAVSSLVFAFLCLIFMNPLLRFLGASDQTIGYARQYLLIVVVIGAFPTIVSNTMSYMLRNIGYSKEASFGLGFAGILNVILDPIFMFVILPDGYQVVGAAVATLLSNVVALIYYISIYVKVQKHTILQIPRKLEKIQRTSLNSILSVGLPAALSLLLYDLTNMIINMLSASHGDLQLAAIGIVLKVERLPLNIGIGICMGMMPLIGYNYASKNFKRMKEFFTFSRFVAIVIAVVCVILYRVFAADIVNVFIEDVETVAYGTEFLKARCFATPVMILSFHMVHFMQAVDRGKISFYLAVIRQICLNIPILFVLNYFFGMNGIIWTQVIADFINAVISYIIYNKEIGKIVEKKYL
ncbi:MAG: MATE family efflux transporter [Dorea sp.]